MTVSESTPVKLIYIFLLSVFLVVPKMEVNAQASKTLYRIYGTVADSVDGVPLHGAVVRDGTSNESVATDAKGRYTLLLAGGVHELRFGFLGYRSFTSTLPVTADQELSVVLGRESVNVTAVTIRARHPDSRVEEVGNGVITLSKKDVANLPLFFGESDFYKALQLMPGVQTSGDGNAALYVRGGGSDQSLMLIDQATVYNPTHLMGFFSVFNTDVINDVKLIKSAVPAEYGNRLSSVVAFNTKKAFPEKVTTTGNLGLIASKVNVDIPVFRRHGAIILAARKTYVNSLLDIFRKVNLISGSSVLKKSGYDFYDLNASVILRASDKDRFSLSGYKGRDLFVLNAGQIGLHTDMDWGNQVASFAWNHRFRSYLYLDNYLTYSGYRMDLNLAQNSYSFNMHSQIDDYTYKSKLTWLLGSHQIRTGVDVVRHRILPNSSSASSDSTRLNMGTTFPYLSYETSCYVADEFTVTPRLTIDAGMRYNSFYHVGPFTEYARNTNGTVTDTTSYRAGETIKQYHEPDFRASARYLLTDDMSVKLSYNTTSQFVHLVNASSVTFPTDFWIPSSRIIVPQKGRQWAGGFYKNIERYNLELSAEVYYKTFTNQLEFNKSIFDVFNNAPLDESLIFGKGRAYGIELLVRKTIGKLTGWVGYTLSKTEKSFAEIESGRWFPAKYDRPNDVSVTANYVLNRKWTFSGVFVWATGSTYTPVVGRYFIANNVINQYGRYNSARMPDYHRLDLSATCILKKTETFDSRLTFSIYNVYNRHNPFFVFPQTSGNINRYTIHVEPREVSIFPILPSVSWQFTF